MLAFVAVPPLPVAGSPLAGQEIDPPVICGEAAGVPPGAGPDELVRLAAGLFRQECWSGAVRLLEAAVREGAAGEDVWRLLGTARYLAGDATGALESWNRIGAPLVDREVDLVGSRRTPGALYRRAAAIPHDTPLTPADRIGAERNLAHLPAVRSAAVSWEPRSLDRAGVRIVVREERLLPEGWLGLASVLVPAAARRELVHTAGSPLRRGDALRGTFRWRSGRQAVELVGGLPLAAGKRVTLYAGGGWREETAILASPEPEPPPVPEGESERVRAAGSFALLGAGGWITPEIRWRADLRRDGWDTGPSSLGLAAEAELRPVGDRLSITGRGGLHRFDSGGGTPFGTAEVRIRSRSRTSREGWVALAGGDAAVVGERAPLLLWPGAGTGTAREPLLRAHPLLDGGTIRGSAFGRRLVRAGVEARWWGFDVGLLRLAPAVFTDAAAVWRTGPPGVPEASRDEGRLLVDGGAGVRVSLPGIPGALRLDYAIGLTDASEAFSVGWEASWPGRDPLSLLRR